MALQELQIYGLWAGKQTAKGTPLVASSTRFKTPAPGRFGVSREMGSERYSDATAFPDTQDWIDSLSGTAAPQILATPLELAWLMWAFTGGETTAAVVGPPAKTKHTTVMLPGLGHWLTWASRVGSSVIDRLQHNDCQISQVEIGGSTSSKAVRITPTIMSLDPAEQRATDPVQAMPVKSGFLYTDGTGRFTIDGTVFAGHSEFTVVINKDLQQAYADDVVIYDLATGEAVVTIAVTLYFDAPGRGQWNKIIYGTSAPAAGTKPLRSLNALGSYGFDLRARDNAGAVNGDKFVFNTAGVRWNVPDAPDPTPAGGIGSVTLNGAMRKVLASPDWQIDVDNDAAAFTT